MRLLVPLIVLVFVLGCIEEVRVDEEYRIVSSREYNPESCESTSYRHKAGGFNSGVKVVLEDYETGEEIKGSKRIDTTGGGGSVGLTYSCFDKTDSDQSVIFAYAKGYSPKSVEYKLQKDKLVELEIPLRKSCSGGESCFENAEVGLTRLMEGNQTRVKEFMNNTRTQFFGYISRNFGLNEKDINLECTECNIYRGGFVKARGAHLGKSPYSLYYRWGWCSSGGADCGFTLCFSSEDEELFNKVKESACNLQRLDDVNTLACLKGDFDYTDANGKTLSMILSYKGSRQNAKVFVEKTGKDCITEY